MDFELCQFLHRLGCRDNTVMGNPQTWRTSVWPYPQKVLLPCLDRFASFNPEVFSGEMQNGGGWVFKSRFAAKECTQKILAVFTLTTKY